MILMSSSMDLAESASALGESLRAWAQARGAAIDVFRWEIQTADGTLLTARDPIQVQIDKMIGGRLVCTLVMLGERIGEALAGSLPPAAEALLELWGPDGLTHPWPEDHAQRQVLLDQGRFPLTGTVYELLAALEHQGGSDLLVAYVADRTVGPQTGIDAIRFNGAQWFRRALPSDPTLHGAQEEFRDRVYRPQVHGLLNLIKALTSQRRGLGVHRCASESAMVAWLHKAARHRLERELPNRAGRLPFKGSMEPYRVDDPLPLPDRSDLRSKLTQCLEQAGRNNEILLLEGPSGCGKSSLLQRGLLTELPAGLAGAMVLVLRPEQLLARPEPTPFLALLGALADRMDEEGVARLAEVRRPASATGARMAAQAASAVAGALERAQRKLVLGIDQFEELIDLVVAEGTKRDTPGGWWQVLRLLGTLSAVPAMAVVGTLESQRSQAFEALDLKDQAGLAIRREHVDFPIGHVRDFVRATALGAGLIFEPALVDKINGMMERFEESRRATLGDRAAASFLPLLGLWLHRLFVLMQDRMSGSDDRVAVQFQTRTQAISPADLEERGLALEIAPLIGELVQAAWEEGGGFVQQDSGRKLLVVADQASFVAHVQALFRSFSTQPFVAQFVNPQGQFDHAAFLAAAQARNFEVQGTALVPVFEDRADENTLDLFFHALVALDHSGNVRLLERPRQALNVGTSALITAFERRRLLVPAGPGRVRLVHQAVLDHWPPGRQWIESRRARFDWLRRLDYVAQGIQGGYQTLDQAIAASPGLLEDVARVLRAKREVWTSVQLLDKREVLLRQCCLELLAHAPAGGLVVKDVEATTSLVHEAARYDLVEPLERWLTQDPSLAGLRLSPGSMTPLIAASWNAARAVKVLLKHGAQACEPDDAGWHPIAGAIQAGRNDIVELLIDAYPDCCAEIGPGARTLAHEAAYSQRIEMLQRIVRHAERPLPADAQGRSPLHLAAGHGRAAHVRLLVPLCEASGRDKAGLMPLHHATLGNHGAAVEALLDHPELPAADREAMLEGVGVAEPPWASPLVQAASQAQPAALAALLARTDPGLACHRPDGRHPIVLVTWSNHYARGGAPLADRVSECIQLLLADGRLEVADAEAAHASAGDFPDAQRLIDAWLIQHGDLGRVAVDRQIDWLIGPHIEAARTVLHGNGGILDVLDKQGRRAAAQFLDQGAPALIAEALSLGLEPSANGALFRLEAALVLHRKQHPLPTVLAKPVHTLVRELASGAENAVQRLLLEMVPTRSASRSLLHRLAIRGEHEAFEAVLADLPEALPLDAFGRRPSELASPAQRARFLALESAHLPSGVN